MEGKYIITLMKDGFTYYFHGFNREHQPRFFWNIQSGIESGIYLRIYKHQATAERQATRCLNFFKGFGKDFDITVRKLNQ